jgi:hypothetical protein
MTISTIIALMGLSALVANAKIQATSWFERFCIKAIDAPLAIGWNVEVSLRCVDGSLGKDLSTMFFYFSLKIYDVLQGCVDLALETLALSGLLNEDSPTKGNSH